MCLSGLWSFCSQVSEVLSGGDLCGAPILECLCSPRHSLSINFSIRERLFRFYDCGNEKRKSPAMSQLKKSSHCFLNCPTFGKKLCLNTSRSFPFRIVSVTFVLFLFLSFLNEIQPFLFIFK